MRSITKFCRLSLLAVAGSFLIVASCKKEKQGNTTPCNTTVYAYRCVDTNYANVYKPCTSGILNTASGSLSTIGSFSAGWYTNQATFNNSDHCYYVFKKLGGYGYSNELIKINASGAGTSYTNAGTSACCALVYNRVINKMYCSTEAGYIAELTMSGGTFTTTNLVMPLHTIGDRLNMTVNNTTGDIYYPTVDSPSYHIEKYHPGATASVVVATGTGVWEVCGLRFNNNDNMLYAVTDDYPISGSHFIKVNPGTGTITSTFMNYPVNVDYNSACIDPCANRYILSTAGVPSSGFGAKVIYQYNMSGALLQHDSTVNFVMGLDADY
ncbi:MAG: hypothetical protein H7257_13535 [Taibaiella sp.]|nr:hypothetical protein [Taibaiella sp.]